MRKLWNLAGLLVAVVLIIACKQPTMPSLPSYTFGGGDAPDMALDLQESSIPASVLHTVQVSVMDSVGGSVITGADIVVYDAETDAVLSSSSSTESPSALAMRNDSAANIVVTMDGYTMGSRQSVTVSDTDIVIYIRPLGMSTMAAAAPYIDGVYYSTDGDSWNAVEANMTFDFGLPTLYVRVDTISQNVVEEASYPVGCEMDWGVSPGGLFGHKPVWLGESVWDSKLKAWTRSFVFDFSDFDLPDGATKLYVAAYDLASNRAELSIPLTADGSIATNIAGGTFTEARVEYRTWGESMGTYGKNEPIVSTNTVRDDEGVAVTSYNSIRFLYSDPVWGVKVERSTDGATWTYLGTVNYGSAMTSNELVGTAMHVFYDYDPNLLPNVPYQYRVTVLGADTETLVIDPPDDVNLLPSFRAMLVGPSHQARTAATGNSYTFTISNPELLDPALSDYYYFALMVKDRLGNNVYYNEFRYDCNTGDIAFRYGNSFYSYVFDVYGGTPADYVSINTNTGVIEIKPFPIEDIPYSTGSGGYSVNATLQLESGLAYQWNIFGKVGSIQYLSQLGDGDYMTSSWFERSTTVGDATHITRSYADIHGNDTSNGWFEFSVE